MMDYEQRLTELEQKYDKVLELLQFIYDELVKDEETYKDLDPWDIQE